MLVALEGKPKPSMDGGGVCPKRKRALFGNVRHPKRKGLNQHHDGKRLASRQMVH